MIKCILVSALAFAATNVDDLFWGMLFFARAQGRKDAWNVVLGKYLGLGALLLLSLLGAFGVKALAGPWSRALGVIPLGMAIAEWLKGKKTEKEEETKNGTGRGVMEIVMITLAGGGDNLGVYIPLLAGFSGKEMGICFFTFFVLEALWCVISRRVAEYPLVRGFIERHQHRLVPLLYGLLALGIFVG